MKFRVGNVVQKWGRRRASHYMNFAPSHCGQYHFCSLSMISLAYETWKKESKYSMCRSAAVWRYHSKGPESGCGNKERVSLTSCLRDCVTLCAWMFHQPDTWASLSKGFLVWTNLTIPWLSVRVEKAWLERPRDCLGSKSGLYYFETAPSKTEKYRLRMIQYLIRKIISQTSWGCLNSRINLVV